MTFTEAWTAGRLLEMDQPVGVHGWPLACYVTEAIENEMTAFTESERRKGWEGRFRLALRRAINGATVYAETWQLDPDVLRAAMSTRRI